MSTSEPGEAKSEGYDVASAEARAGRRGPLDYTPERLTDEEFRSGLLLGPGESRAIEIRFEELPEQRRKRVAETRHKLEMDQSVSIGDRKNSMPWSVLLLFTVIGILAGWGIIYALSRIL